MQTMRIVLFLMDPSGVGEPWAVQGPLGVGERSAAGGFAGSGGDHDDGRLASGWGPNAAQDDSVAHCRAQSRWRQRPGAIAGPGTTMAGGGGGGRRCGGGGFGVDW